MGARPKPGRGRRWRGAVELLCVATFFTVAAVVPRALLRPDRFHRTLRVTLPDGDRIVLGYQDVSHREVLSIFGEPDAYDYWLIWEHGRRERWYLVAHNGSRPPAITLRADGTPAARRLWLVCGDEVVASLDRANGRCVNRGGWSPDPTLAPEDQRQRYLDYLPSRPIVVQTEADEPHLAWARPRSGVVLGRSSPTDDSGKTIAYGEGQSYDGGW